MLRGPHEYWYYFAELFRAHFLVCLIAAMPLDEETTSFIITAPNYRHSYNLYWLYPSPLIVFSMLGLTLTRPLAISKMQ